MRTRLYKLYTSVRSSLWLIPVLCVLIGAAISFATIALDRATNYDLIPPSLVGTPDAALQILATVATSMVSLTALVLTIVLVVVQLAMGQFSPRIVQRLLRDRPSQIAIGLFVATFVHTLLAIREVDLGDQSDPGHVPGVAVLAAFILALASIAVLVMYVHHVGQALRISALVELAGNETRRLLERVYPDHGPDPAEERDAHTVVATKSGVVTVVAHEQLVQTARNAECVLELVPSLGEYVPAGAPLFTIHGESKRVDDDTVRNGVILSMERTLDQDVAYGLRLLVDMTERSLSDSRWQDPTTAVQAIDRLHDCLRQLVRRPIPDGTYRDDDDQLRLIQHVMTWEAYVHLAFDEIRLAGAGSPQVARRMQAALRDLLTIAPPDRRDVLQEQLDLLGADYAETLTNREDVARAHQPDPGGINTSDGRSPAVR
ncbi:MAG: DUF2254 domain-containing protein [Pseudonocardiales bacterium]